MFKYVLLALALATSATQAITVYSQCKKAKTVALTFDDGPYDHLPQLLKLFDDYDAKATFFFNGNNFRCIYDLADSVLAAYNDGHQIASHTWSHADLATLTKPQLRTEFKRVEDAIRAITGSTPAFTRPPFGSYNQDTIDVANERGQDLVMWDFDAQDAAGFDATQSKNAYNEIFTKAVKPVKNVLTLNHETHLSTVEDVIPYALKLFSDKGFKMVTVAECLGKRPYKAGRTRPGKRNSTWKCD